MLGFWRLLSLINRPAVMNKLAAQIHSLFKTITRRGRNRESFEQLFNGFREVLDRNNRSLEIITEMGDTLGGDYLFDIQYVRRSYAGLSAAMDRSLASFDALTRNRYPRLRDRFLVIDGQIRRVIEETAPASEDLVLFYEDIRADMAGAVGGKNNNLADIKNTVKLNVPDAFAVTTRAFDVFLRHNHIFEKARLPEEGTPVSEAHLHDLHEQVLYGTMPPELSRAIEKALKKIKSRCGTGCTLAVRSSAGEEDGDFSFAGQFETVLNVPLELPAVEKAYRKVVASLFAEKAAVYQKRLGYDIRNIKMAVACVVMVDAAKSGVVYSTSPEADRNTMVINSVWGLGAAIVEGQTDGDFYRVKKSAPFEIAEMRTGAKDSLVALLPNGGTATVATPAEKRNEPSLSPEQAAELVRLALRIEDHFKRPQDIEWAIDRTGEIFILQSRPLKISEGPSRCGTRVPDAPDARLIAQGRGLSVQKGVAAGRVFVLKNEHDINTVPRGAVLVARRDSSHFVRVMTHVAAIITDIGTPTSHMATLCREFRIPTVVNAGNATQLLAPGEEITVQVDSEGATFYQGAVRQLLECAQDDAAKLEDLFEFRKKRYLLRYIAPLNLVDPLRDEFTPQACRTMHDILRFIHEKSVAELIESAERVKAGAVRLELPVPAGIMLIDIGGGLDNPEARDHVTPEQVASLPLRAIIRGMTMPGIWRSDAVPMKVNDFITSMLRVPDITSDAGGRVEQNMAVISREYANINLKFGYHFIILDCYCSANTRNNHIYFRFAGGATDMTKRSRRLELIAAILGEYGFSIKTKGDLIVARLANIEQAEAEGLLDQIGRLFSYTRQLDAVLNDDQAVERYARSFLEGNYELAEPEKGSRS
jgi:pyruvate,water dikinase